MLMEVHGPHFSQWGLQLFVPIVEDCLAHGRSASDRCLALHLAGDAVEKLGEESVQLWPHFMAHALDAIVDEDSWVRQASAYAVLRSSPCPAFAEFAAAAAGRLAQAVSHPKANHEGNKEATEAATAALGRVCRQHAGSVSGVDDAHLLVFLNGLPLVQDLEQAASTHELLMEFVRESHPLLQEHAGKVCEVFLEIYGREALSSDTLNEAIRALLLEIGEERLRQMQPPFSEKHKKRIVKILRDARESALN